MTEPVSFDPHTDVTTLRTGERTSVFDHAPSWAAPWLGLGVPRRLSSSETEASSGSSDGSTGADSDRAAGVPTRAPSAAAEAMSDLLSNDGGITDAGRLRALSGLAAIHAQGVAAGEIEAAVASAGAESGAVADRMRDVARTQQDRVLAAVSAANDQLDRGQAADLAVVARTVGSSVALAIGDAQPPVTGLQWVSQDGLVDAQGRAYPAGGLLAGYVDAMTSTLPAAVRGVEGARGVARALGGATPTDLVGSVLDRVVARGGSSAAGAAAYLDAASAGTGGSASTFSLSLGAYDATSSMAARDAAALRPVAAAGAVVASTAATALAAIDGGTNDTSSAPGLVTVRSEPGAAAASVTLRVLSVATPTRVASDAVPLDQVLANGGTVRLAISVAGSEPTGAAAAGAVTPGAESAGSDMPRQARSEAPEPVIVEAGPAARLADVAEAINRSGAGVRATTEIIATGAARLQLTALATGRTASVVVTDGGQPPSAATVLGRFVNVAPGSDTIVLLDKADGMPKVLLSHDTVVPEIAPGVSATVHAADPGETVIVSAGGRPERTADAIATVTSAVATVGRTADRVLRDGLGQAAADDVHRLTSTVVASLRGLPGLRTSDEGAVTFDRRDFIAAYRSMPRDVAARTRSAVEAIGRAADEATAQRVGYLAARLDADRMLSVNAYTADGTDGSRSGSTTTPEAGTPVLGSLLARLTAQQTWLRSAEG